MVDLNLTEGTVTGSGWEDPTNVNDGSTVTAAHRDNHVSGPGTLTITLSSDLGAPFLVDQMVLDTLDTIVYTDVSEHRAMLVYGSDDGSSWTAIPFSHVYASPLDTITFDDPEEWRHFRLSVVYTITAGIQSMPSIDLRTWEITEAVTIPEPDPSEPGTDTPYEEPDPRGVFLEIYVSPEDSYRWDVATWDESTWSSAAWTDVTPEGVQVTIRDGSDRADLGILAKVAAADWTVYTHDPDRRLDPANPDGPWFGEITPGLPIRLSHGGAVLATGSCLSIEYGHADHRGVIKATDCLFALRQATVPPDTVLPDTLYARVRAVLAAVGRSDVAIGRDPSGGDPAVAPWDLGDLDTAWTVIEESAREILWFPMVGPTNALFFRAWADPVDKGKVVGSPWMEELHNVTNDESVVSVVRVNDAVSATTIERRITPLPRYGERVHERTRLTLDGDAYATAVLFDRGAASTRWVPGDVHPWTAPDVDYFARIVPGELVAIDYPEADPPVDIRARVLGRTIHVIGANSGPGQNRSRWWFRYQASVEAAEPLAEDGAPFLTWLTSDDGDGYLYPDGVIALL